VNESPLIIKVNLISSGERGNILSSNIKYDQINVRKYHYFLLLGLIQKHKRISRSKLAELTKMSNTSVGKIVKNLIEDELVIEVGQTEGEVGRRATILEINPKGSYIIGVEIELNTINVALVSLNGEVIVKKHTECDMKQHPEDVLDLISEEIITLTKQSGSKVANKIIAIGVSMPGLVSWPEGKALMVPQFHWDNVEVKAYLERKLDYVVYVDNDVRTVLLAENLFGSMTDFKDCACLYIGSGVGGAVMVNGEILRGYRNTLGEIGHITLDPNGMLCDCGRLGCLQTFICSSEIEKQTQRSIHEVFNAFEQGEDWAVRMINRARKYLSLAISNIVCMYNPKAVLLAGPMVQEFTALVEGVEALSNEHIWSPLKNSFQLIQPKIGENTGVIGASALVLNEFLRHTNNEI